MIENKFIFANWKMNCLSKDALALSKSLLENCQDFEPSLKIALFPISAQINIINAIIKDSLLKIGAQNCYYENNGAFTGEISALQLRDLGCKYVIIGHSERRQIFNESNQIIAKKILAVQEAGMIAILCCGESADDRRQNKSEGVISSQLKEVLKNNENLIIAYEPIWAIGSGQAATCDDIYKMHFHIRNILNEIFDKSGNEIAIIYGGSVNEKNASEIALIKNVSGVLVGGASLVSEKFVKIATAFS